MIFATDHEAGTRIMSNIYSNAAAEFQAMRERARRMRNQAREAERGVQRLFDDDESLTGPPQPGEAFYEHEPPDKPVFPLKDPTSPRVACLSDNKGSRA